MRKEAASRLTFTGMILVHSFITTCSVGILLIGHAWLNGHWAHNYHLHIRHSVFLLQIKGT
jgi:hypothetical protein